MIAALMSALGGKRALAPARDHARVERDAEDCVQQDSDPNKIHEGLDDNTKKVALGNANRRPDNKEQQPTTEQAKADQKPAAYPRLKSSWYDVCVSNIASQEAHETQPDEGDYTPRSDRYGEGDQSIADNRAKRWMKQADD